MLVNNPNRILYYYNLYSYCILYCLLNCRENWIQYYYFMILFEIIKIQYLYKNYKNIKN